MADNLADRAHAVLPSAEPGALGLDPDRLVRLYAAVEAHIAAGRYPGAQLAIARHGRLKWCSREVLNRSCAALFGIASGASCRRKCGGLGGCTT